LPTLGQILLVDLKSYEGLNTVVQHGGINRRYLHAMLEHHQVWLGPMPKETEYGTRRGFGTQVVHGVRKWLPSFYLKQ
jgi:hypothetical protein